MPELQRGDCVIRGTSLQRLSDQHARAGTRRAPRGWPPPWPGL